MKYILLIILLYATLFAGSACSNDEVNLREQFFLHIGQSANLKGEELQIKFLDVVEDSRCPRGVTCIWEGRISCLVEITYRESIHNVVLTEPGLTNFPSEKPFQQYTFTYHIEPYPEAGTDIAKEEYQLELKIRK